MFRGGNTVIIKCHITGLLFMSGGLAHKASVFGCYLLRQTGISPSEGYESHRFFKNINCL